MRPLALAGILAALVGCSKPYDGTSFSALPKLKHATESETRASEPAGEPSSVSGSVEIGPAVKTAASFPKSAQPTGRPPVMVASEKVSSSSVRVEGE